MHRYYQDTNVLQSDIVMDQYLLIPFSVGWTSIYQLFWCSPGVQGFDTLPYFFGTDPIPIKPISFVPSKVIPTAQSTRTVGEAVCVEHFSSAHPSISWGFSCGRQLWTAPKYVRVPYMSIYVYTYIRIYIYIYIYIHFLIYTYLLYPSNKDKLIELRCAWIAGHSWDSHTDADCRGSMLNIFRLDYWYICKKQC